MAAKNSSALNEDPAFQKVLMATSGVVVCGCVAALVSRVVLIKVLPTGWKSCLLCLDVAHLSLSLGLLLVSSHLIGGASSSTCRAGGFFLVFGILDAVSSLVIMDLILLLIQNPAKISQLSTFRWQVYVGLLVPQKSLTLVLAALPVSELEYFDTVSPYTLTCFPVRQEGGKGAAFGAILIFIVWGMLMVALSLNVAVSVRFWGGPGTRVHASTPSLWQTQKIEQSRTLHKFTLTELAVTMTTTLIVTIVVYTNTDYHHRPRWLGLFVLAVSGLIHVGLAAGQLFLWSGFCCDTTGQKKEPHHRLKELELIQTEGPGKLRLKVSWAAGKGVWKRGLLKVYGPDHIKSWAQEIVVLGLLRKSGSAQVLQCLWTSNNNPYHEAMTLISGDIVTNDSRLTCLELTPGGTLQEMLRTMKIPLPEPCQRTIMHDIAEGLSHLHHQNVLHRNLTSAAVYIKGSVPRLAIRAAVGDFEDSQIYGTLLTGSHNSTVSRKRFFYPDIRAYALVGVELLARVCECRRDMKHLPFSTASKDSYNNSRHTTASATNTPSFNYVHNNGGVMFTESPMTTTDNKFLVKRFHNIELAYCAPGQPDYSPERQVAERPERQVTERPERQVTEPRSTKTRDLGSEKPSRTQISGNTSHPRGDRSACADSDKDLDNEYNIDSNWKLQARTEKVSPTRDGGWGDTGKTSKWKERPGYGGVPRVKKTTNFTFPTYSIFRTLDTGSCQEEEDEEEKIEERIELTRNVKHGSQHIHYQQAGYVTALADDGREVFIPATYRMKRSRGNSSSGYGSCTGSLSGLTDQYSSAGTINTACAPASAPKRVHKTTFVDRSSPAEGDILEVLPAVRDSEHELKGRLEDIFKSKQDAQTKQIMASYDETIRKRFLGTSDLRGFNGEGVCPKNSSNLGHDAKPVLNLSDEHNTNQLVQQNQPSDELFRGSNQQHTQSWDKQQTESWNKGQTERHSTRQLTHTKSHPSHEETPRLKSASNASFQEWSARSSLKRNRARKSLKKALTGKHLLGTTRLSLYDQSRGSRDPEIEHKYSGRHVPVLSREAKKNNITSKESKNEDSIKLPTPSSKQNFMGSDNILLVLDNNDNVTKETNKNGETKSRGTNKSSLTPRSPLVQHVSHKVMISADAKEALKCDSSQTNTLSFRGHHEDSFTSVEPTSTDSEHTNMSRVSSCEQTSVEKIESDMKAIIQSNRFLSTPSGTTKLIGLRIIESGFDSGSVSSEESCLCAASALQIPEEGTASNASEILSQGKCSCACSSCLGGVQGLIKESSWVDSPDSDSWNNSNSFSSYDNNMHTRKLSRKRYRHDITGCALAPDDQYPSPVHHGKTLAASPLQQASQSTERHHRLFPYSSEHNSSSASEASVTRRYRDLMRRGVPLRVSVISGETCSVNYTHGEGVELTSTTLEDLPVSDSGNSLPQDGTSSDAQSFQFRNIRINPTAHVDDKENEPHQALSPIPSLEDIIKEIPDETGCFSEETKSFLSRPDSELSVKALQAVLSRHGSEDKEDLRHSGSGDEIFSQHGPRNHALTFGQGRKDVNTVNNVTSLQANENNELDHVGTDGRLVTYCQAITATLPLISVSELLPASLQNFDKLRSKLQELGNIGFIGNQILDLLGSCWNSEAPPTSAEIVNQLTDHVTETEL